MCVNTVSWTNCGEVYKVSQLVEIDDEVEDRVMIEFSRISLCSNDIGLFDKMSGGKFSFSCCVQYSHNNINDFKL